MGIKPTEARALSVRGDVEYARIASAFAIVWYHTPGSPFQEFAYSGLIIFIIIAARLSRPKSGGWSTTAMQRFNRLAPPWLFWFAVYTTLNQLRTNSASGESKQLVTKVLEGPAPHLWFLPFIFLVGILISAAGSHIRRTSASVFSACTASVLLLTSPFWRAFSLDWPAPLPQYAHALPAVLIGITLISLRSASRKTQAGVILLLLLSALVAIRAKDVGLPYLIGIAVGSAIFLRNSSNIAPSALRNISALCMGVYLSHIAALQIFGKYFPLPPVALTALVFACCALLTYVLHTAFPAIGRRVM